MLTDLDAALDRFQQSDLECGDGSANLGPVAVTALEALGHPALIPFFVDVYVPRLRPLVPGTAIPQPEQAAALGDRTRRGDWLATFEAAIAETRPAAVLERWLPVLLPRTDEDSGAAVQRAIAARVSLEAHDAPRARRELASGLAAWASRARSRAVESAERPVGPVDLEVEAAAERILTKVEGLAERQLAQPEARLAYGAAIQIAMAFHAALVFVPVRMRSALVARVVDIADVVECDRGAGAEPGETGDDPERDALARDAGEIRYRAACSRNPDAIIGAEACLRAHALKPSPVFLAAAADAALRIGARFGG